LLFFEPLPVVLGVEVLVLEVVLEVEGDMIWM
jgi:hypothetical protein